MAVYEVFSQPELRRYKTHICTKATILQLFIIALTFIPPFFVAYRSVGFWQRVDNYLEVPDIHFKHKVLAVIETSTSGDYIAWSTYPNFNQLQMENLRVPLLKSREVDDDRDGKNDRLHFQMDMPLLDTEEVIGVKLLLVFSYKLYKFSTFEMESMATIERSSAISGSSLEVIGDLRIQQRQPLSHKGLDVRYNESVIPERSIYADDFEFSKIYSSYFARNVTSVLKNSYPSWKSGRGAGRPFVIKATVTYPEDIILYTPGFWQEIKHGWIQYLAVLLIFLFVFDRIKVFIFQNQIVTTIVQRPWEKPKMS